MGSHEGNWGPAIIGLTATCEALVLIFIVLRVYTRVWIARTFWWDDFTIILAVLGTTIGCSLCFVEVHYGFGKHIQFLSEHELRQFRKYTFGEWIQTFATLMWTKVSICLFLIRIPNSKMIRGAMYWCVGFLLFSNSILTTMWIMGCQPVHAQWYGEGICLSKYEKEAIIMTQAIISIVSDFLFAGFPIFYFWRLQVDFKTKLGLWLLMCLGVITGACCIARTVLNGQSIPEDETYDGIVNWTWRLFEVQFGIIAACVPTLRPLYSRVVALRKRERPAGMDGNIKFLPTEKAQRYRWLENSSHSPHSKHEKMDLGMNGHGRGPSGSAPLPEERPRKHTINLPGKHPRHAEDMRQDLVNEGILKSNAHNGVADRGGPDVERRTSYAGLVTEMHRYGIPDEFSSLETGRMPTAYPTPKTKRDDSDLVDMVGGEGKSQRSGKSGRSGGGGTGANRDSVAGFASPKRVKSKQDQILGERDRDCPSPSPSAPGTWRMDLDGRTAVTGQAEHDRTGPGIENVSGLDWQSVVAQHRLTREPASMGWGDGIGLQSAFEDSESGRSARSGGRGGGGLQEVLDSDEAAEGGVGPMQAAREWEPGTAM